MNYASYNGYIKKLLGLIFILSDDFSMFKANVAPNDMAVILFLTAHQCHLPNKRTAYWLWSASEAR